MDQRWGNHLFFSSRRRHTILQGDWSSDVCSSDLLELVAHEGQRGSRFGGGGVERDRLLRVGLRSRIPVRGRQARHREIVAIRQAGIGAGRSEERRVGKEVWGGGDVRWEDGSSTVC